MSGSGSGLVPCGVVVDSRNVHGQARKVFGLGTHAQPAGIKRALNALGLDPVVTYVALGTRLASAQPSARAREARAANLKLKADLEAQGAKILDGMLAERAGVLEEKQVDVLCAVKIADLAVRSIIKDLDLGCIVVLSEDMDLMPAYDLANLYGVPTYAAAYDSVHRRAEQRNWLLLTEVALAEMCAPRGRMAGSALRSHLAEIALGARSAQAANWRVLAANVRGMALMGSNNGSKGLWRPDRPVKVGDRVNLVPVGISPDPESNRFPYLQLDADAVPVSGGFPGVSEGEVLYWVDPTRIRVSLRAGVHATLNASPGTTLPGDKIAVLTIGSESRAERHLIGVRASQAPTRQWSHPESLAVVEVTADRISQGWHLGRCMSTSEEVLIHAKEVPNVETGRLMHVAYAGWEPSRQRAIVMPLSTCLPANKAS